MIKRGTAAAKEQKERRGKGMFHPPRNDPWAAESRRRSPAALFRGSCHAGDFPATSAAGKPNFQKSGVDTFA
jgi:hypothetical protein